MGKSIRAYRLQSTEVAIEEIASRLGFIASKLEEKRRDGEDKQLQSFAREIRAVIDTLEDINERVLTTFGQEVLMSGQTSCATNGISGEGSEFCAHYHDNTEPHTQTADLHRHTENQPLSPHQHEEQNHNQAQNDTAVQVERNS